MEGVDVACALTVLKKVALAIIGVFTPASMLMVFDPVRQFGTSILASAGIIKEYTLELRALASAVDASTA